MLWYSCSVPLDARERVLQTGKAVQERVGEQWSREVAVSFGALLQSLLQLPMAPTSYATVL